MVNKGIPQASVIFVYFCSSYLKKSDMWSFDKTEKCEVRYYILETKAYTLKMHLYIWFGC